MDETLIDVKSSNKESHTTNKEEITTLQNEEEISEENTSTQCNIFDDKPMSKNQLKKQRRHQRWMENRAERRKAEREKIKQKRKRQAAECELTGSVTPPTNKTRKMDHPDASEVRIVIDCSYDNLMNNLDIKKLVKQIQRCYAENRRVEKPLQYYVCNFKDKTKDVFDNSIQGYKQWDVYFEGLDPEEKFGKENLVFLAAESPNVLEDIDPQKVYIIGGLVDHNHHKGVCFQHAVDRGWEHAQLPLVDNIQMKARKVITVNHVFEILLQFVQCKDWHQSISNVIPLRKQAIATGTAHEFLNANNKNEQTNKEVLDLKAEDESNERNESTEKMVENVSEMNERSTTEEEKKDNQRTNDENNELITTKQIQCNDLEDGDCHSMTTENRELPRQVASQMLNVSCQGNKDPKTDCQETEGD